MPHCQLAPETGGQAGIMGDHHQGHLALAVEGEEQLQHFFRGARVEVAGWFVGEDQRRLADQRASDGDALPLAAGEVRRTMAGALGQADPGEHRLGPLQCPRRGIPR